MLGISGEVRGFQDIGTRDEMKAVQLHGVNANGAHIMAVLSGHGDDGKVIAESGALSVVEAIGTEYPEYSDAMSIAQDIGAMLARLSLEIEDEDAIETDYYFSGAAATVAVAYAGKVALAWMGHARAYYVANDYAALLLTKPHDRTNDKEFERAHGKGGRLVNPWTADMRWTSDFVGGQTLTITRAIGDIGFDFVDHEPEFKEESLIVPGRLVIGSSGFWGRGEDPDIFDRLREGSVDETYVQRLARQHENNAAVIIAPIG
ncbi:MAG TPA: hypothetical protein VLG47_06450 [Candidatus Saccharimonadales bacterium]|nr:hypothetical protein [Candidatus Saccharimonadales bacterium]